MYNFLQTALVVSVSGLIDLMINSVDYDGAALYFIGCH
jgi:hypothetical protein